MPKSSKTPSDSTLESGKYGGTKTTTHGAASVAEIDAAVLQQAIYAVLEAGDAVLFGTTRDGGAVAMQLYSGDTIDKLYAATPDELRAALIGVQEAASIT